MTKISSVIILVFLLCATTTAEAQFFKRLKKRVADRAEEKATQKIEEKAEEKVEAAMDSLLNENANNGGTNQPTSQDDKTGNDHPMGDFGGLMGDMMNTKDIKIKSKYAYDITATIEVKSYERKTQQHIIVQSYGNNTLLTSGKNSPTVIHDFENEAAITLDIEKGTAHIMSLSWMTKMMSKNEGTTPNDDFKITKTGKTKHLIGYQVDEYLLESEEIKVNAWIALNMPFDHQKHLSALPKMFDKKVNVGQIKEGYLMEMTLYEKGKKNAFLQVLAISNERKEINMNGYEVVKMF